MMTTVTMSIMTLVSRCLSPDCQMGGLGCDNMTCVLVCLLHQQPYQVQLQHQVESLLEFMNCFCCVIIATRQFCSP